MDNEQICFHDYRLLTFAGSVFEKNRRKCTAKNMAEAGFYFNPSDDKPDRVNCYACGIEVYDWNKNDDDPWQEHLKLQPDCFYLKTKQSYEHDLTVLEFLEIEKYRFICASTKTCLKKRKAIKSAQETFEKTVREASQLSS